MRRLHTRRRLTRRLCEQARAVVERRLRQQAQQQRKGKPK